MLKRLFTVVPLAVLALTAPAAAESAKHARTYKAELVPVVTAPEATPSARRDDVAAGVRGRAKLVDGPRRDKLQLHVRGLTAGESYSWSLREASGVDGACTGDVVDAFEYEALEGRRRGHGRERARSRAFAVEDGTSYAVVVTAADGTDVACGELEGKASRKQSRAERKAAKHGGKKGARRHDAADESDEKADADDELDADEADEDDEPDADD